MTLADAIRKSRETGSEFWRGNDGRRYKAVDDDVMWRWEEDDVMWRYFISFGVADIVADDWQVEQTAPHGEGM